MVRIPKKSGIVFLFCFLAACSSSEEKAKALKPWIGEYSYEEEPIKAIAGYYMAMIWDLKIEQVGIKYFGHLDINGQQTYMKIKAEIVGNEKAIAILFLKFEEGSSPALNYRDTLFTLTKKDNQLVTTWSRLEPRLAENSPRQCNCFSR